MEVCVDSLQSALNAARGGAARLELCSALSEGGLTPTPGLLKAVTSEINIPVYCMLRVKGGNDFVYSEAELEAMKTDALLLRAVGKVDGFVFGALTSEGNVDVKACEEILQTTSPLPVTFHRAIDVCNDPLSALHTVIQLGFKRVLTSGQEQSAEKGIPVIKEMVEQAGDRISIMIGAGVNEDNVASILNQTGAREYHGSAKVSIHPTIFSGKPQMGVGDIAAYAVTDAQLVADIIKAAESVPLKIKKSA